MTRPARGALTAIAGCIGLTSTVVTDAHSGPPAARPRRRAVSPGARFWLRVSIAALSFLALIGSGLAWATFQNFTSDVPHGAAVPALGNGQHDLDGKDTDVLLVGNDSRAGASPAELKALKAQVNPHFLFNSLNSISALTAVDAAKARQMCIHLSDFLRNSLRLGERAVVPFAEELTLTRAYLEVEQVRFGSRLRVFQDFDDGCSDCEVPPLLVQPLIENAIKHGIATLVDGGEISMTGRRSREGVRVVIENPFDPDAPETRKSGFGLINVRNRLQARYGSAARLEIQVEENRYRVILSLPCETRKVQLEEKAARE